MKYQMLYLAAVASLATAVPHRHAHEHLHEKRVPTPAADVVTVAGPTVVLFSLGGSLISEAEVMEGINNGTLVWANGAPVAASSASSSANSAVSSTSAASVASVASTTSASSTPSSTSSASATTTTESLASFAENEKVVSTSNSASASASASATSSSSSSSVYVTPTTSSAVESSTASSSAYSSSEAPSSSSSSVEATTSSSASSTTSSAAAATSSASSSSSSGSSSTSGVGSSFPDGTISCSSFPSDYGAVYIDYMGLGGWIGVQDPGTETSAGYDDITTQTSSTCSGSDCCADGMFCSYACPAGYQKSQWPSTQGATDQSVGGLECKDGLLYITNSDYDTLCIKGTSEVDVQIVNNLSQQVSVCRTDYPGTESETVPLSIAAGATEDLTCPDEASYYKWEGKLTSAQYYVNPAGYATEDACVWGDGSSDIGNWAPLILGAGYSDGVAYLSLFPNTPTTDADLDYKVTIAGDDVTNACYYSNGKYYAGSDYKTETSDGCTVAASSGTVTVTFSDSDS